MNIIAIGKKHEKWVLNGIELFEKRLKKPFNLNWDILPHSNNNRFAYDQSHNC